MFRYWASSNVKVLRHAKAGVFVPQAYRNTQMKIESFEVLYLMMQF